MKAITKRIVKKISYVIILIIIFIGFSALSVVIANLLFPYVPTKTQVKLQTLYLTKWKTKQRAKSIKLGKGFKWHDLQIADEVIFSKSMKPGFFFKFPETVIPASCKIRINELPYSFYTPSPHVDIETFSNYITLKPSVDFFPRTYQVEISYLPIYSREEKIFTKNLNFRFFEDFSTEIQNNPYWHFTSESWSITSDKKLQGVPPETRLVGSTFFARRFSKNLNVEFDLWVLSEVINLQIFIGSEYSLMIGDGDNRKVILKKSGINESGKKQDIELAKIYLPKPIVVKKPYRIKFSKLGVNFSLYIQDGEGISVNENNSILNYTDEVTHTRGEGFNTFGFGVWRGLGCKGILIDNVLLYEEDGNQHAAKTGRKTEGIPPTA